jgi:hypothetical protein
MLAIFANDDITGSILDAGDFNGWRIPIIAKARTVHLTAVPFSLFLSGLLNEEKNPLKSRLSKEGILFNNVVRFLFPRMVVY